MKDKRKSLASSNCVTTASSCIKWDGPNLPCLDICTGDELNDFLHAIAAKICAAIGGSDFSTLSMQCLIDKLNVTLPTERDLLSLFQLAFDNDCKLKDLIDILEDKIGDPNKELTLNLGCLQVLDGFGNPIPVTQTSLNQTLVTNFCRLKQDILSIQATLIGLQAQIDAIDVYGYEEPVLSTCLLPNLSLSQQVIQGFTLICNHQKAVGTVADIQGGVNAMPGTIQMDYMSNIKWKLNADNLGKSESNQWLVIDDLLKRIKALEDCACKFDCNDITIGFTTTFNDDNTATLKFTAGAGTTIPVGFTDCGSSLIVKNDFGIQTASIPIIVGLDGETIDIDMSSFTNGEYLTFALDVKLCSDLYNCSKCVSKVVRNTLGCCSITNSGTTNMTIIYKTCGL